LSQPYYLINYGKKHKTEINVTERKLAVVGRATIVAPCVRALGGLQISNKINNIIKINFGKQMLFEYKLTARNIPALAT
jgi:hypothetical protein